MRQAQSRGGPRRTTQPLPRLLRYPRPLRRPGRPSTSPDWRSAGPPGYPFTAPAFGSAATALGSLSPRAVVDQEPIRSPRGPCRPLRNAALARPAQRCPPDPCWQRVHQDLLSAQKIRTSETVPTLLLSRSSSQSCSRVLVSPLESVVYTSYRWGVFGP
jgi:hypothetical protein